MGQGNQFHIDFSSNCIVAYLTMYLICKIKDSGTFLNRFLFSFWRKYNDIAGSQIVVNHIQQVECTHIRTHKYLLDLGKPFVHLTVIFTQIAIFLVCPMCSNTLFCNIVHSLSPDLNFNPDTSLTHQCTMESFIPIALWMLDPIPYPIRFISV